MEIKKILKNLALGFASSVLLIGTPMGFNYINERLEDKLENSAYMKNIREEQKAKKEFEEDYLNALKKGNVKYVHCGKNIPLWYVDIDGDKKFEGYLLHVIGSIRGSNDIGLYPIKK